MTKLRGDKPKNNHWDRVSGNARQERPHEEYKPAVVRPITLPTVKFMQTGDHTDAGTKKERA